MKTASDICIDCNLCCSSNLGIRIYPDEYERVKDDLSNVIQLKDLKPWKGLMEFHLNESNPGTCPQLGETGKCGIYEKRPHVCRTFKCGVLNEYEREELSYDEVQELIQTVKGGDKQLWNTRFMTNTTTYRKEDISEPDNTIDPNSHLTFEDFLTEEDSLHIANILRRDEHKILAIPNDSSTGYRGTTAQYSVYNLLTHPDIRPLNIPDKIFALPIFKDYNELWVQCWGNVLHQGQNLPVHCHAEKDQPITNDLLACSIYLDGLDPCYTHWEDGKQVNTRGTLHVAGKFHEHEVKTNVFTEPRISMAFDIYWNTDEVLKTHHRRFLHIERKERVIYESEYKGMPMVVKESNTYRKLYFGHYSNIVQTIVLKNSPTTLWYTYVNQLCGVTNQVKDPQNALVLGLGGGIIPSWLQENTKCDIDVVEIIPELKQISHEYFNMPEKGINVIIDDAFDYVSWNAQKIEKLYDIIVVDISDDTTTFMQRFDDAFYKDLQNILTPNGCVAINYFAWIDTPEYDLHIEQLENAFEHVTIVKNPYPKNNNCITYCSNTPHKPTRPRDTHTNAATDSSYKQIDSNTTWGPLGE